MNGIKPTYLWHLTGKKHFRKLLTDRETCVKHSLQQRERRDFLQFTGYLLLGALGTFFAFGGLGPKNKCPMKKDPLRKKKCTGMIPPKCPSDKDDPMKTCPLCGGQTKRVCDPDE